MTSGFAFPPPPVPSVAISGRGERFPVRRIFCVGRNYAEHAREMGHNPDREPPFFFTKPADAIMPSGADIAYPPATENLHFEGELVAAIAKGGADIARDAALDHVFGYAPGNELTRRDLQATAKAARRPWDMGKAFDASAVCGALLPVDQIGHPTRGRITTTVNGEIKQDGDIADMIWPLADVIAYLSGLVTLQPGDLIYTGTPAGVGALHPGDRCEVAIAGLGSAVSQIT